jgi:Ca2+-binding RTX toxin-like protein
VDLLDLSDATGGINFTLDQTAGTHSTGALAGLGTDTYSNMEGVIGSNFNDTLNGSGSGDVLKGADGNDALNGNGGNDILVGGAGADNLTGGAGSDTFVADAVSVDTITDFTAGAGGDILNLADVLTVAYNPATPDLFISLRESGGNTIVSVDRDGSGGTYTFQDVAVLQGVTSVNLNTLLANGNIDPTTHVS